jgi:hypothetical protein
MRSGKQFQSTAGRTMILEDQARLTLDRMAYAIMGAARETIDPGVETPFSSDEIRYEISLGVQDGEVVWGDPEKIWLGETRLQWAQALGTPDERTAAWSNAVRELLEGELLNGVDDNGNGLTDERGVSFTVEGDMVRIRLCLAQVNDEGQELVRTVETVVTCRN